MLSVRNRTIRKQAARRGYENLLAIRGSKSQKHVSNDAESVLTKQDRQLLATNELYNTAARMKDANALLLECIALLKDSDASMNQRKLMSNNIKKLIVPLNEGASSLILTAAKDVAPMPGCADYHRKCEVERKHAANTQINVPSKKARKVTIEMELIAEFLKSTEPHVRKATQNNSSTPRGVR